MSEIDDGWDEYVHALEDGTFEGTYDDFLEEKRLISETDMTEEEIQVMETCAYPAICESCGKMYCLDDALNDEFCDACIEEGNLEDGVS